MTTPAKIDAIRQKCIAIKNLKQPKYQIGQEVWMMSKSGLYQDDITGIYYLNNGIRECFYYTFEYDTIDESEWIEEKYLFPTKQSLIDSLKRNPYEKAPSLYLELLAKQIKSGKMDLDDVREQLREGGWEKLKKLKKSLNNCNF